MDIILIHPPPWAIEGSGRGMGGQPAGRFAGPLLQSEDFLTAPYGLLSIAAQAIRAGHNVITLNLSNFPWPDVREMLAAARAPLYGLSCYTSNRRGAALTAALIKELHPAAHVVIGGPHVTALPERFLNHHPEVDAVVIGEGERTFMELVERLEAGAPISGLAGAAWRAGGRVESGPPRPRIGDIDSLASPVDYFPTNLVITSRGCPERCTFCASRVIWGSKLKFHSVEYTLAMLETAVNARGIKALAIKDDTFTADRQRIVAICRRIVERGLRFLWSCDTRADYLDEGLLAEMRLAGCQRISLGVESADQAILENIKKRTTPEKVLEISNLARGMGFEVRHYYMVGNRGENLQTLGRSLDFIKKSRPHEHLFALLTIYPGTEEFSILARRRPDITPEVFFTADMVELEFFAGDPGQAEDVLNATLSHLAAQAPVEPDVGQCARALDMFPDLHLAHLDMAAALMREGGNRACREHLDRALALGYPLPGVILNYLACLSAASGDVRAARIHLKRASGRPPAKLIAGNLAALDKWEESGGYDTGELPRLGASHDFMVVSHLDVGQPIKPGPITIHSAGGGDRVLRGR